MSGPSKIGSIEGSYTGAINALELLYIENPATGKGRAELVQTLLNLLSGQTGAPITNKTDISDMLAGENVKTNYLVNVTDASAHSTLVSGWALFQYKGDSTTAQKGDINNYQILIAEDWFKAGNISLEDIPGLSASDVQALGVELYSLIQSIAQGDKWKQPVDLATTGNVTLSGEQTIDDVLTSTSDVLVHANTDPSENGIYTTGAGAWTRRADADAAEELYGAVVQVLSGTANEGKTFRQIESSIVLETDPVTWIDVSAGAVPNWSETEAGKVKKGTNAEALTGTEALEGDRNNEVGMTPRLTRALIIALELVNQTALDAKANRDQSATEGNLAEFDANGHPVDAGKSLSELQTEIDQNESDISDLDTNKQDKVTGTAGQYVITNGDEAVASGDSKADLAAALALTDNSKLITAQKLGQVLTQYAITRPNDDNQKTPNAASVDFTDTGIAITHTPTGIVEIELGDTSTQGFYTFRPSYGDRTGAFYFGVGSNGATSRAFGAVVAGDHLFVNPTVLGYDLATTHRISLDYLKGTAFTPTGNFVPNGGTTGQVLAKQSNTDGDVDWEDQTGGTGGSGTSIGLGKRNFEAGTTSPPSNQGIRYNNATPSSVTEIYIDDEDLDDQDRSNAILETTAGSLLRIITDESNFNVFKVTSVTDNTGSFTIVVTHLETKGTISGEVSVEVDLVQDISGKVDKTVEAAWSPELLFNQDSKEREHVMDDDIIYTKASSGNIPNTFIQDYISGDGIHTVTIQGTESGFYQGNDGVFDNTKVNAIIWYYDKNGRVRYTIENLETIIGLTPLSAPTNLQAVSGGPTSIITSIDAVENASSYNIQVSENDSDWELLANVTDTTYEHTGLTEGQTRYYRWQAVGDGITYSSSGFTTSVNATTSSGTTLATPVLTMTNVDSITNRATWTNVSGETGFQLERSADGTTGWATIYTAAANELTEDDATCTPEVQYFYRVKALGNGTTILDSAYSTVQSIITDGVQLPTLNLTTDEGQITGTFGNVDPNYDATEYERSTDESIWTPVEEHTSPDIDSVVDSGLTNAALYYFRYRVQVNGVWSTYATASIHCGIIIEELFTGTTPNTTRWPSIVSTNGINSQNGAFIHDLDAAFNTSGIVNLQNAWISDALDADYLAVKFDFTNNATGNPLNSEIALAIYDATDSALNDNAIRLQFAFADGHWKATVYDEGSISSNVTSGSGSGSNSFKVVFDKIAETVSFYIRNGSSWDIIGTAVDVDGFSAISDFKIAISTKNAVSNGQGGDFRIDNLYVTHFDFTTLNP